MTTRNYASTIDHNLNEFRPTAEDIEALLQQQQQPPSELVKMFCFADLKHWSAEYLFSKIARVPGFERSVLRHPEEMKAALHQHETKQLLQVIILFTIYKISVEPFLPELVTLLMSNSKQVRDAVAPLLYDSPMTVMPLLQHYLKQGKPNEKILAVQWLSKIAKGAAIPLLTACLEEETDKKVRNEIQTVLGYQDSLQTVTEQSFNLPPLPEKKLKVPLPEDIRHQLHDLITLYNHYIDKLKEDKPDHLTKDLEHFNHTHIDKVFLLLQGECISEE